VSGAVAEEIHSICKVIDFSNQGYNRLGGFFDDGEVKTRQFALRFFSHMQGSLRCDTSF
jgi:hypothetical protein